jgi:lipopolysaccharide/colanic/teichoic acid biosynthesis glycosyltransferase
MDRFAEPRVDRGEASPPAMRSSTRTLLILLGAGLALRLALALLLDGTALDAWAPPGSDAQGYDEIGWNLAQRWRGGGDFSVVVRTGHIHVGYHFIVALIYAVVGHVPLVVKLLNALVGTAAGWVTYAVGRHLWGERAALWAAGTYLFWPSLVYWSAQNLKDPWILLATAIGFWAATRLFDRAGVASAAVCLAAVLALSTLRTYQALLLVGAVCLGYFFSAAVPTRRRLGVCAGTLVLLAGLIAFFRSAGNLQWNYFHHVNLRWLQQLRDLTTVGGSAFFVGADISTVPRLLAFLPRGALAALLFPLPALSGSVIHRAAAPETIVWYALLPFIIGGTWRALRTRRGPELVLVFFAAGHLCALAVVQGNGGTLLRQRAPALLAGFLLASPGLADLAARPARAYAAAKRAFDVLAAGIGSLLLLPLFAAIALGILLTDGRPIFYQQERLGQDKRRFGLLKFRTMVVDADRQQGEYSAEEDPRITRVGRWLRRYSLDELPQLWNILRGDMSLVGPRPMRPILYEKWSPLVDKRLTVRPGLTGWQQVNGRNSLTWEEMVALDAWYVDHASLWLDLKILWRTVDVVLGGEGLYFRSGPSGRPGGPE